MKALFTKREDDPGPNHVCFKSAVVEPEDLEMIYLKKQTWEEMGCAEVITLTIEVGDTL